MKSGKWMIVKRGELWWANFDPVKGSEQGGTRPVLIIQNNIINKYAPITIAAPITGKIYSKVYPYNVLVTLKESGLKKDSTILLNQIRTIDKKRLINKIGNLDKEIMKEVDMAIKVSLDLS